MGEPATRQEMRESAPALLLANQPFSVSSEASPCTPPLASPSEGAQSFRDQRKQSSEGEWG
jgi:hypothetical protein